MIYGVDFFRNTDLRETRFRFVAYFNINELQRKVLLKKITSGKILLRFEMVLK